MSSTAAEESVRKRKILELKSNPNPNEYQGRKRKLGENSRSLSLREAKDARRRWEEMDGDIMVNIMQRVMRHKESESERECWDLGILLPLLKELESHACHNELYNSSHCCAHEFGPYYDKLEAVYCSSLMVSTFAYHSKCITTLRLYGVINNYRANVIGKNFPLLNHLEIPSCALSMDALPTILDGHTNLVTLNTRHSFLVARNDLKSLPHHLPSPGFDVSQVSTTVKAMAWKEICNAGIHLQCKRRFCSICSILYY
ncbi:hypothetical protein CCACVL1_15516 [Corchorus capsularis]|uniref:Uncharacterized protein n=1 Tax=Corchorus capsularis TaxID=210143 RepID=A0A1R3I243_COCAP|nr:hypothetical protein CCACVL1_15516 [Corchorus capsularis]